MSFALRQTIAPYCEPIHVAEAKAQLRVDGEDEDSLILGYIAAARRYCEEFQGRQYVVATWKRSMDGYPCTCGSDWCQGYGSMYSGVVVTLPRPPLVSVTGSTYVDTDGVTQTLGTSLYAVNSETEPGSVAPAYGQSWPMVRDTPNSVAVTYRSGYITPFTVDATTNVLTVQGRTFADGDVVRLSNSGGELPAGLALNTDYYVRDASGSTLKLALTAGGTAIDITSTGGGQSFIGVLPETMRQAMLLLVGHYYENREGVVTGTISKEIEFAVSALLWPDRVF